MNRTLLIEFAADGSVLLNLEKSADGFHAACQGVLVNLINREGDDKVFPDRGTDLQARALNGQLFSIRNAEHAGNIGASDCLFFHRRTTTGIAADKIEAMELQVRHLGLDMVSYGAGFVSVDGRSLSFTLENST